jgi:hypothetical protein
MKKIPFLLTLLTLMAIILFRPQILRQNAVQQKTADLASESQFQSRVSTPSVGEWKTARHRPADFDDREITAESAAQIECWRSGDKTKLPLLHGSDSSDITGVVMFTGTAADGQSYCALRLDPNENGYEGEAFLLIHPLTKHLSGHIRYEDYSGTYLILPRPDGGSRLKKTREEDFVCHQPKENGDDAHDGYPLAPEPLEAATSKTKPAILPLPSYGIIQPDEGAKVTKNIRFKLSRPAPRKTTLTYQSGGFGANPAVPGEDFVQMEGTKVLNKGTRSFSIPLTLIGGNSIDAPVRLAIKVQNPEKKYTKTKNIVTILPREDNEPPPPTDPTTDIGQQGDIPVWNSKPGSSKLIYLDFNGATVAGTAWNTATKNPVINSPTSETLLTTGQMQRIWSRVSSMFDIYNVNISTDATLFNETDAANKTWAVFTSDPALFNASQWAGLAYFGSFGQPNYQPAVVCVKDGNYEDFIATAAIHELGHAFNLKHDGSAGVEYYRGHGSGAWSWGPAMGASYSNSIQQWCKGEYSGANNTENDLEIIAGFIPREADEPNNSLSTARNLTVNDPPVTGRINNQNDADYFLVTTTANQRTTIEMTPTHANGRELIPTFKILSPVSGAAVVTDKMGQWYPTATKCTWIGYLPQTDIVIQTTSYSFGNPTAPVPTGATSYGCVGNYSLSVRQ